ncbi:MAG: Hpt domain-containing protein [Bacteroidetes bacterium]|nr:Hpt domain-containing protein [Bacteroidota bacterium]MDA1120412.1 Hpt domain-containing protein [Bacteroidota bacterium]
MIGLNKLYGLDLGREFIEEVIAVYLEEIPIYLNQAQENFDHEKREDLKRNIHTLKSHSTMLEMMEINLKLKQWENEVLVQPLSNFKADFDLIKSAFKKALAELKVLQSTGSF